MKWEEESSRKKSELCNFTPNKCSGRPGPGCLDRGSPQAEAAGSRHLCSLGWGVAAAGLGRDFLRLGHSCWVGMLQRLAVKECSPLTINLVLQQPWPLAVQNYSLDLSDA